MSGRRTRSRRGEGGDPRHPASGRLQRHDRRHHVESTPRDSPRQGLRRWGALRRTAVEREDCAEERSGLVPELLEEYGAIARAALSRYLARGEPRRHLYDPVADYPLRAGRMLRPSLL